MTTINNVTLLGNIGNIETRYSPNGVCVLTISLATQERVKDKETPNNTTYMTEWHRVVCFGKNAEYIGTHAIKGTPIFVQGALKTNKYKDKQTGQDRYATQINANVIKIIQKDVVIEEQQPKQQASDDFDLPF